MTRETKQQSSVWLFQSESPPVKFKRSRSTSKRMITVIFANSGQVASVPPQERKTVNAERYINTCPPRVFEAWSARRPNDGGRCLLLDHDHASDHTAAATLDHQEANRVQLVTQTPSYSPDLASCHLFLFPQVKQRLKGKQFQGVEDDRAFFEGMISDMPQSTLSGAMVRWFEG